MSGIVKGIGKVFKKVGKAVKKILPAALAIGAVVFTAGAALGLPAMAGGWGAAVTKGLGALGIGGTSTLGSVLTGAVTQAGYGAVIGGVGSAAMGGSFTDGAAKGALAGAVTGGFMGGMGKATDPLGGFFNKGSTAAPGVVTGGATGATGVGATGVGAVSAAAPAVAAAPATGGLGGFFSSAGGGQIIAGLGKGLMTGLGAKAGEEADERIRDSYELDADQYGLTPTGSEGERTPEEAYGAPARRRSARSSRGSRWEFNPETQRIEMA